MICVKYQVNHFDLKAWRIRIFLKVRDQKYSYNNLI